MQDWEGSADTGVMLPLLCTLALLRVASIDDTRFLEGTSPRGSQDGPSWIAVEDAKLSICWRSPKMIAGAQSTCFIEYALPSTIPAEGHWRVRFSGEESVDLLSGAGAIYRITKNSRSWTLVEQSQSADASLDRELVRSALFFAPQLNPCSRRHQPVPRGSIGDLRWELHPCAEPCPSTGGTIGIPRRPVGLKLSITWRLDRQVSTHGDLAAILDAKAPTQKRAWEQSLWLDLSLRFDPPLVASSAPYRPRGSHRSVAAKASTLGAALPSRLAAQEKRAMDRIHCGASS